MSKVVDGEEPQDEQEPATGPVTTVPTVEGPVQAPADAASHWDARIWGRA
ncbi:hypothetical protein [Streptomyces marokkonensis]|nr:hypothetical protein [Streptomyces marokkonensis]